MIVWKTDTLRPDANRGGVRNASASYVGMITTPDQAPRHDTEQVGLRSCSVPRACSRSVSVGDESQS
jgi:hypothetical protein